ncbi:hypothetical protein RAS2_35100 [Phycisphaerae bacterium RAS2]|nr:hypothetical protein RAS2_35100 [Phycisphaerae bacterium RAS2]
MAAHEFLKRTYLLSALLVVALGCLLGAGMECPMQAGDELPPDMDMEEEEEPKSVSFGKDIQPIFDTHCIRCHVNGGFANNSGIPLRLVEGVSHELLVGKFSVQNTDLFLVKPGDHLNSLLYLKISQDTPPVGRRMPWDAATVVTEEEIALIVTWINEGAVNN